MTTTNQSSLVNFNINEWVRVKLTERGKRILREQHEDFLKQFPFAKHEYIAPIEDTEGWSEWQLWALMEDFGPHMTMGFDPPFKTDIQILLKKQQ